MIQVTFPDPISRLKLVSRPIYLYCYSLWNHNSLPIEHTYIKSTHTLVHTYFFFFQSPRLFSKVFIHAVVYVYILLCMDGGKIDLLHENMFYAPFNIMYIHKKEKKDYLYTFFII